MSYHQMETLTYERQAAFLAEAEQQRLVQTAIPAQAHPLLNWIGQQLFRWGKQLLDEKTIPALPITPKIAVR